MKKIISTVLIFTMVLTSVLLGGCSLNKDATKNEVKTRVMTDMDGNEVTLPEKVDRIAISGTAMNQLALMVGGASKIVATLPSIVSNPWYLKVYPEIKDVSTPFQTSVNLEELASSKPDVVMLWKGNDDTKKSIENLGIPVFVMNYSTIDQIKNAVMLMGEILGDNEKSQAQKYCEYFDGNIKKVSDVTSKIKEEDRLKIYYSSDSPLTTEGKGSLVSSWIKTSGGINLAEENGIVGLSQKITIETLLKWNPDVIIVRDIANYNSIMNDQGFKAIKAVKEGRVYLNPKGVNVWCARSGDTALQPLWASKMFYPDLFKNTNVETETKYFYKTFYGYDLTDDELKDVLNPTK